MCCMSVCRGLCVFELVTLRLALSVRLLSLIRLAVSVNRSPVRFGFRK